MGDSIARRNVGLNKRGSIAQVVFAALLESRFAVVALSTAIKSIRHGNKIGWCAALHVRQKEFLVLDYMEQKELLQPIHGPTINAETIEGTILGGEHGPGSTRQGFG